MTYRMTEEQLAAMRSKTATRSVAPLAGTDTGRTKFNNKKVVLNGLKFDSKKEARRHQDLTLMQAAGQISELRRQVPYPLVINGIDICTYIADFVYVRHPITGGSLSVVEDVKGFKTPEYRMKNKMMFAVHNIRILET